MNVGNFDSVHIVRKAGGKTEVTSGRALNIHGRETMRIQSRFNDKANEVIFGAAVVLVEGEPDEIACRRALESLVKRPGGTAVRRG